MPVTEYAGDLFSVPEGSVLIHSCNCQGSWGGGVAAAFRDKVSCRSIHPISGANASLVSYSQRNLRGLLLDARHLPPQEMARRNHAIDTSPKGRQEEIR